MKQRTTRNALAPILTLASLCAVAGCHPADNPSAEAGSASDHPAIQATLHWEKITDGRNSAREAYANRIDTCNAAGWPVKELTPDEIARLGTGQVELWIDGRGAYARETSWKLGVMDEQAALEGKGVCMTRLEEAVTEGDDDYAGRDTSDMAIDGTEQAGLARVLGFQHIGTSQVGGQPCTRWRSKDEETCEWSAGRAWGIDDGPAQTGCATQGPMDYLNPIPLEAKPVAGASGCIVQLQSMTVGKGLLPQVARALDTPTGD